MNAVSYQGTTLPDAEQLASATDSYQGTPVNFAEASPIVSYQGTTLRDAEQLASATDSYEGTPVNFAEASPIVSYQGTTSVVPYGVENFLGFSPCGFVAVRFSTFSAASCVVPHERPPQSSRVLQSAEQLASATASYQGTTSVVPYGVENFLGFSPCSSIAVRYSTLSVPSFFNPRRARSVPLLLQPNKRH